MFRGLSSKNFPPFGEFSIEFPAVPDRPTDDSAEVHLFAGVNGTGKTRLLAILASFLGSDSELIHRIGPGLKECEFFAMEVPKPRNPRADWPRCGLSLNHESGAARVSRMTTYPWINSFGTVPAFAYRGGSYVSDRPAGLVVMLKRPDRASCLNFRRSADDSKPLFEALIQLKIQSAMDVLNDVGGSSNSHRAGRIVRAVEQAIEQVTGGPFSFRLDSYPQMRLSVRWGEATMSFNSLPDGLCSIIGWLVHAAVMMDVVCEGNGDVFDREAVFLLDEIESHLHPKWQRSVLPAFQRLFPKAQIFVATHSPFVIASLNHGWIHPFRRDADGKVTIGSPEPAKKGDSYVSVLEDVMGVTEWYDLETEALLGKFRSERDAAFKGDEAAYARAKEIGRQIAERGRELELMMGKELHQLETRASMTSKS